MFILARAFTACMGLIKGSDKIYISSPAGYISMGVLHIPISNHISCTGPNIRTCILSINIPIQREVTSNKYLELFCLCTHFILF